MSAGDQTYPLGYWYFDDYDTAPEADDMLFFRMRLDVTPKNCEHVWQILLDTDEDGDVEWVLQIDMKVDNRVEFVQATTGGPQFDDIVLSTTPAWTGTCDPDDPPNSYCSCTDPTGDGSNFDGNADVFAGFAVPWTTCSTNTGLSKTDPFRVGMSTSTTHTAIITDFPVGLASSDDVASNWTDPISGVPEPSSLLFLAVGLTGFLTFTRHRRS